MDTTTNTPVSHLVQTRHDHLRACGWRQPGARYLIAATIGLPCGRLPCPTTHCPTCGHGVKLTRRWQWFEPAPFFRDRPCTLDQGTCDPCPLAEPRSLPQSGLLWVGATHYASPRSFLAEASSLGVSKRIPARPRAFLLGITRVYLAHPTACIDPILLNTVPGIFASFVPTAIEYVVTGTETDAWLEHMIHQGITPVRIERIDPEPPLIV
jgi:hypothetical protein